MIDIGANLTNKRFKKDFDSLLERATSNQVDRIIVTGTDEKSSVEASQLCQKHPNVLYSTAGFHPHHASEWNAKVEQVIRELITLDNVLAVGECGLDFNRNFSTPEAQKTCFESQLQIAVETQTPVFLHERDAYDAFSKILEPVMDILPGAVVHCFTGSKKTLSHYLEMGCFIGITGWICDERRGGSLRSALPYIPLDRLMIETDAPYLLPRTMKSKPKNGRNEPSFLPVVLEEIANILDIPTDVLEAQTTKNAESFFGIPPLSQTRLLSSPDFLWPNSIPLDVARTLYERD